MDVIGLHLVKCVFRPRIAQQIIELGTPSPIRTLLIKRDPSIDVMQHLKRCWIPRARCGARNWPAWCGARRTRRWWRSAVPIAAVIGLKIVVEFLVEVRLRALRLAGVADSAGLPLIYHIRNGTPLAHTSKMRWLPSCNIRLVNHDLVGRWNPWMRIAV